jgi:hypothetical protein
MGINYFTVLSPLMNLVSAIVKRNNKQKSKLATFGV